MADNEKRTEPDELSSPHEEKMVNPEQKKHKAHRSIITALSIMLLIILGLSFSLYEQHTQIIALNAQQRQFAQRVDELKQIQETNKAQLLNSNNRLQKTQNHFQQRLTQLQQTLLNTSSQRSEQKQDWLLLKARYYLELAQINAHWSDNQQTTSALLQEADALLKHISDPSIFTIRQTIAREITQIKALPKIDLAGLLSQLDALQTQVLMLPIKKSIRRPNLTPNSAESTQASWRQYLKNSINRLEKMVVIRHHGDGVQPLLSPLHQNLLRESIRLNLQEAQWALLQNNQQVYQNALKHALTDIKRVFIENSSANQAIQQQLQKLQLISLTVLRPEIEESLSLLNQFIDEKSKTPLLQRDAQDGENKS